MLILLISFSGISQNLISYVTVYPDNAYIGQPVQLKVSVFTTTWFTSGIDVGNIQVDGALTVYFRSLSNSREFNGKKYAGVDFYYNVFPTNAGEITIPVLEIQVESPKEGGYKGIKHTIKTKPKTITVKGVPLGYDPNNWLVARSLNVSEKWSTPLTNVKVGDVIQRTITRSAGGTLAEFFPKTTWDSIVGVSNYPMRPKVNTHKSKTAVSATRIETVNYLFEKEGEITIPSIEYLYYNSSNKKFYRKQTDSITITVKPNADLAMLASIKKSLQKEKEEVLEEELDRPFLILGMTPKEFFKYLVLVLIGGFILLNIFKKLWKILVQQQKRRLQSEAYSFKKVTAAIQKKDFNEFLKQVNSWLLKLNKKSILFNDFVEKYGSNDLKEVLDKMNEAYFKNQSSCDESSFRKLNKALKSSRKNYLLQQKKSVKDNGKNNWLNPTITD